MLHRSTAAPLPLKKEFEMAHITDHLAGIGQAQLDTVLRIAEFNVDTLAKLATIQVGWGKEVYGDVVGTLRSTAATRDGAGFAAASSAAWQPVWERNAHHAKNVWNVLSSAQGELLGIVDQQVAEFNRQVVIALDAAAKSAPAGSEGALNAVKSAIHATNSVYEAAVQVTRQASNAANAGLSSLTYQAYPAGAKAA
jgi:phasin protein